MSLGKGSVAGFGYRNKVGTRRNRFNCYGNECDKRKNVRRYNQKLFWNTLRIEKSPKDIVELDEHRCGTTEVGTARVDKISEVLEDPRPQITIGPRGVCKAHEEHVKIRCTDCEGIKARGFLCLGSVWRHSAQPVINRLLQNLGSEFS